MTKLLRLSEVAEMTGVPEATLRFWRHQEGKDGRRIGPKSAKLGRRVVYRAEDVERWIEEQFSADGNPAA